MLVLLKKSHRLLFLKPIESPIRTAELGLPVVEGYAYEGE
jgi:hypothetical protein